MQACSKFAAIHILVTLGGHPALVLTWTTRTVSAKLISPQALSGPSVSYFEVSMQSLVLAGKATLSVALLTLLLAIAIHICVMLLNATLPDAVLGYENGAERPGIYTPTNPSEK